MSNFQKYLSIVILLGVFLFTVWSYFVLNLFWSYIGISIASAYHFFSQKPNFGDIDHFLLDHIGVILLGILIALSIQTGIILSLRRPVLDKFGNFVVYIKKGNQTVLVQTFRTMKELKRALRGLMGQFSDCRLGMYDLRMVTRPDDFEITRDDFIAKLKEMINTWPEDSKREIKL